MFCILMRALWMGIFSGTVFHTNLTPVFVRLMRQIVLLNLLGRWHLGVVLTSGSASLQLNFSNMSTQQCLHFQMIQHPFQTHLFTSTF